MTKFALAAAEHLERADLRLRREGKTLMVKVIGLRPYIARGRKQLRIGVSYRRPGDPLWRRRYRYLGFWNGVR